MRLAKIGVRSEERKITYSIVNIKNVEHLKERKGGESSKRSSTKNKR